MMKEKVFVTVPLMKRVISIEMEKMFPELSFQIVNLACFRKSILHRDLELQSYNKCDSDDTGDTSDNDNPLNDSDCQFLPPRKQVRASITTKRGLHYSATKHGVLEIFEFHGFWKFLNKIR